MVGGAPSGGVAELKKQEGELSNLLTTAAQLEAHGEALLQRSVVRSGLGNHFGALEDAERASALLPKQAKCHYRLIEALLACRDVAGANRAYDRARLAFASNPPGNDIAYTLDSISWRLRPCLALPDEVLVPIFELVYTDWEQLPSPFQLCHVNSRWRNVANSTRALWRDTRILRMSTKVPVGSGVYSRIVRRPFCFPPARVGNTSLPVPAQGHFIHPRAQNQVNLLQHCARRSHNTLNYFELETLNADSRLMRRVFKVAEASTATLVGISIVSKDVECEIASAAFDLVLRCPLLADLQLSIKGTGSTVGQDLREEVQTLPMPASLRSVKLSGLRYFAFPSSTATREALLQRCRRLESVTLVERRLPHAESSLTNFGADLLVACAEHLVELEMSSCLEMIRRARSLGVLALPQLRRYSHITTDFDREFPDESATMGLPAFETVEGPLDKLVHPAPCIIARFDRLHKVNGKDFATWLQEDADESEDHRLQDLTLDIRVDDDSIADLGSVIDVLVPSLAGKVVCPRLRSLAILLRHECAQDAIETGPFDTASLPRPIPKFRDQWERSFDVSRLARMEAERRRMSVGLPPDKRQRRLTEFTSTVSRRSTSAKEAQGATDAELRATPGCVAMERITLEGCYVDEAAWEAMKKSACRFDVMPSPDEMVQLPYDSEAKRKRTKLDESDA